MIAAIEISSYHGSPGRKPSVMRRRKPLFCTTLVFANSSGADKIELAKMTGITPPEFTFSGRCVA